MRAGLPLVAVLGFALVVLTVAEAVLLVVRRRPVEELEAPWPARLAAWPAGQSPADHYRAARMDADGQSTAGLCELARELAGRHDVAGLPLADQARLAAVRDALRGRGVVFAPLGLPRTSRGGAA